MAEESKKKFDPDATVAQPAPGAGAGVDPDATVSMPIAAMDPDATVSLPAPAMDPDATFSGPLVPIEPDADATFTGPGAKLGLNPESTDRMPTFDPDATVNPTERVNLDPNAGARSAKPGKARANPFAPKSTPEAIQTNLAALGGLNPLIALANPILGAVPQIRRTLKHPDPAGLRANLRDQIESLQTSASFAEVSDASAQTATYALCALLDESAAATPWGGTWLENGLLKEICGESGGGEGFFTRLDQITAARDPVDSDNADLIEFFDVCLALGFEGRYRKAEGGRLALHDVRGKLYTLIARRRPRPRELSGHWRSATAEAAAAPALQMAAEVTARISAQQMAGASEETTLPPVRPSFLSRVPRRAVWSAVGGIVGVMLVFYMAALRLLDDETKAALAPYFAKPKTASQTPAGAPAPVSPPASASTSASANLAKALAGDPVTVAESAGRIVLSLRHEQQFPVGGIQPAGDLRPVFEKIAAALDGVPGAITVTGHADSSPTRSVRWASNVELSAARARAVAQLMAPKLKEPGRVTAEGKGDADPIAPGNSEADRARNRRITISVKPNP